MSCRITVEASKKQRAGIDTWEFVQRSGYIMSKSHIPIPKSNRNTQNRSKHQPDTRGLPCLSPPPTSSQRGRRPHGSQEAIPNKGSKSIYRSLRVFAKPTDRVPLQLSVPCPNTDVCLRHCRNTIQPSPHSGTWVPGTLKPQQQTIKTQTA